MKWTFSKVIDITNIKMFHLLINAKADMVIDSQMSEMRGYSLKNAVLQLPGGEDPAFA